MTQPLDIPTPEAAVQGIRDAFEQGNALLARRISEEAIAKFPDNPEMQHWAYLLAPPIVTRVRRPPDPGRQLNRDWLTANQDRYQGQWILLRNGELMAHSASSEEFDRQVDQVVEKFGNLRGFFMTKVW